MSTFFREITGFEGGAFMEAFVRFDVVAGGGVLVVERQVALVHSTKMLGVINYM